jgi:hypothetical protein
MRLSVASLRRMIKGKLHVEFVRQELTSYSGLEVFRPYLRQYGQQCLAAARVLAHNLARSFQLDTLATPKPRSRKRTYAYLIRSMRTLHFLLIARAGRLTRIGGRHVLSLSHNLATESLYASVTQRLAA